MSMGVFVFSDRRLETLIEWQRATELELLGMVFLAEGAIEDLRGFLPVRRNGVETGFECSHRRPIEVMEMYPDIDLNRDWKHCLALNWRGDFDECLVGYSGAAAYARATDGVVFDPQDGLVLSADYALQLVRKMNEDVIQWRRVTADTVARMKP